MLSDTTSYSKIKPDVQRDLSSSERAGETVDDHSTPRNQSYLSNVTEQAKKLIYPNDTTSSESKYYYPEDTDSLDKNQYTSQSKPNITHKPMVDVVDDEDIARSERRLRELAAQNRRGSVTKETKHYSKPDTEKSGLLSKISLGSQKQNKNDENYKTSYQSGSTSPNENTKKTFIIPEQSQYSAFEQKTDTRKTYKESPRTQDTNKPVTGANDFKSSTNYQQHKKGPEKSFKNLNTTDYEADYPTDRTIKSGTFGNENYNDTNFEETNDGDLYNKASSHVKNRDNTNDIYKNSVDDVNDGDEAGPSIVTKVINYVIGADKTSEKKTSKVDNEFNTKHESMYNDSHNYENNLPLNSTNPDTEVEKTDLNVGSGGITGVTGSHNKFNAYESNLSSPTGRSLYETRDYTDQQTRKNLPTEKHYYSSDKTKYVDPSNTGASKLNSSKNDNNEQLKNEKLYSSSGANKYSGSSASNTNLNSSNHAYGQQPHDVTTDMFADSDPYRLVQNKDNKEYLKSEYSDGLKINEKKASGLKEDKLSQNFDGKNNSKQTSGKFVTGNNYIPTSSRANTDHRLSQKDMNYDAGEQTLNAGIGSPSYDGYYAATKSNVEKQYQQQSGDMTGKTFNPGLRQENSSIKPTSQNVNISKGDSGINKNDNRNTFIVENPDYESSGMRDGAYGATNTAGTQNLAYKRDLNDKHFANEYLNEKGTKLDYGDVGEPELRYNDVKKRTHGDTHKINDSKGVLPNSSSQIDNSGAGEFVLGSDGTYQYSNPTDKAAVASKDVSNNNHYASYNGENSGSNSDNKGFSKIKNLFSTKDKKAKKEVEKRNITEHGTVYHSGNDQSHLRQTTGSDFSHSGAVGATDNTGNFSNNHEHNVKPSSGGNYHGQPKELGNVGYNTTGYDKTENKNIDYSTAAANKSFNKSMHTSDTTGINQQQQGVQLPSYEERNINPQQGEHRRKKSLIDTIKHAL